MFPHHEFGVRAEELPAAMAESGSLVIAVPRTVSQPAQFFVGIAGNAKQGDCCEQYS
jgi:hypothetical protein